jgi:hypothetical protein
MFLVDEVSEMLIELDLSWSRSIETLIINNKIELIF